MMRYWISWWQPTEDYRPLNDPPANLNVLGWWCSGHKGDEADTPSICALVQADSEAAARKAVYKDWPEAESAEWRFVTEESETFLPNDRFPLKDWSKIRLK
jgi:hypothetical protein